MQMRKRITEIRIALEPRRKSAIMRYVTIARRVSLSRPSVSLQAIRLLHSLSQMRSTRILARVRQWITLRFGILVRDGTVVS
jgi:hypothetical protein